MFLKTICRNSILVSNTSKFFIKIRDIMSIRSFNLRYFVPFLTITRRINFNITASTVLKRVCLWWRLCVVKELSYSFVFLFVCCSSNKACHLVISELFHDNNGALLDCSEKDVGHQPKVETVPIILTIIKHTDYIIHLGFGLPIPYFCLASETLVRTQTSHSVPIFNLVSEKLKV